MMRKLSILLGILSLIISVSCGSDGSDTGGRSDAGGRDDAGLPLHCPELIKSLEKSREAHGAPGLCDECSFEEDSGAPYERADMDCDASPEESSTDCVAEFEPAEATIADIQRVIRSGEWTCEQIVEEHLERIAQYDLDVSEGPPVNAFVMFNEQVRAQARALDEAFSETGELSGTLHCVPIAIKANYDSTDTLTTGGSLALKAQASRDGFALQRMRDEGAILIGSTAMDEFAYGVQGIGGAHGKTGNAYDRGLNSGGSSAGSGAAVAAGFVVGATGTDNCGSLTVPAAYGGAVTIRPTLGLVSLDGVFPSGRLDATAGPIARTTRDLAIFLDAMATQNPDDPMQQDPAWRRPDSFVEHLNPDGLRGKRIGVVRQLAADTENAYREPFVGANAESDQIWARALRDLERLGAEVVENIHLPEFEGRRYGGGWAVDINDYLAGVDSPSADFEALCRTNDFSNFVFESPTACMDTVRSGLQNPEGGLAQGEIKYRLNREYIEDLMDCLGLDALIYPADALGPPQRFNSKTNCIASANSGLPTAVIQVGFTGARNPLPIAMMLMGRRFDEAGLIEMAYAYENATHWRQSPEFLSLVDPRKVEPLDLEKANQVRRAIGRAALEEVLRDGNKYDLTADRSREITHHALEEAGLDYLLEPEL